MNQSTIIILLILMVSCGNQAGNTQGVREQGLRLVSQDDIRTGAQQTEKYFPILKNKSLGLVCNHTSLIGNIHLVDSLYRSGFDIKAIFSPEHGFRGEAGAGDEVRDGHDPESGLPVISLYGNKKKPAASDLEGIDLIIFDIQDVGVRFYTYISTLALVMDACADKDIPVIVLDRPNPNGFYLDGPVLDTQYRSFVGMHPVPVVYGMTIGEYALMVNGEGWLENDLNCDLTVIPLENWDRNMIVRLPVRPSPNLPTWQSVYLYPSFCLFEGTVVSVGRGTEHPFELIGHPDLKTGSFIFTPVSIKGAAENPPHQGKACNGQLLTGLAENFLYNDHHFSLFYLLNYFREIGLRDTFFNAYFDKLSGTSELRQQVIRGLSEEEIRASWQPALDKFKEIRKKYLLYPDIF